MVFPEFSFDREISLGDVAATLAFLVALFGAGRALRDFSKSLRELKYAEIDRLYFDLQRAALEYPDARYPPPTGGEGTEAGRRYDIYAGMVWAFLETVCDRCERDDSLIATWYPILEVEADRHIDWLRRPENAALFKEQFRKKFLVDQPA